MTHLTHSHTPPIVEPESPEVAGRIKASLDAIAQARQDVAIIHLSDPYDMADLISAVAAARESGKACLVVKEGSTQTEIDERLNEILHEVKMPLNIAWLTADQCEPAPFIPRESSYERANRGAKWFSGAKKRRKW